MLIYYNLQNFKTADKNVAANEQIIETLNTTKSVLESSDTTLDNCAITEPIKMNDSVQSELGRTSRFGRKIKSNRLSDHEFVSKVPINLKLKKVDIKSLKTCNPGINETDDSSKQSVKTRGKILVCLCIFNNLLMLTNKYHLIWNIISNFTEINFPMSSKLENVFSFTQKYNYKL